MGRLLALIPFFPSDRIARVALVGNREVVAGAGRGLDGRRVGGKAEGGRLGSKESSIGRAGRDFSRSLKSSVTVCREQGCPRPR